MQRFFVQDTEGQVAVLFVEPKLMHDKTSWAHFAAQQSFCRMARESHRHAITISHHIWDRAVKMPCGRHARCRHSAYDLFLEDAVGEEEALLASLMSWVAVVGCACHDLHNALRWSVVEYLDNVATMRNCLIVLESLRNSFDQLIVNMPRWMVRSIDFVDHGSPASLAVFWGLFGLDEGWIQLLVHLQLRWHGGRLLVARRFAGDDSLADDIYMFDEDVPVCTLDEV